MMEKIKVKNKYERKWIILGIVYVLFIVCAPIAIEKLIIANSYSSGASNDGWASFFGSYLGGVFGGTATLMAVLITIRNGKKEQEEEIAREKEELIRKSALIVYYDFEFAFTNIHDFMIPLWKKRKTKSVNQLEKEDMDAFFEARKCLNQFYFNDDWIKTVANLYDSPLLERNDIKKIYEIYGHLMTIKKCIDCVQSVDEEILKNAYRAMNSLMNFKLELVQNALPDYIVKDDIKVIMDKLKKCY